MKQNNHPASRGPSIFLDKWGRGKSRWLAEVPSSSRLTYKMAHYRLRKMEVFRPSMYFILHGPIKLSIAFKLLLGWQLAKSERGQIFGHLYFIQQILINPDRVNYRKKKRSNWRKIHCQFCYWVTYNSLQTKFVPFVVGKKTSQNFMRKKEDKVGNKTGYKRKDKRKKKRARKKSK